MKAKGARCFFCLFCVLKARLNNLRNQLILNSWLIITWWDKHLQKSSFSFHYYNLLYSSRIFPKISGCSFCRFKKSYLSNRKGGVVLCTVAPVCWYLELDSANYFAQKVKELSTAVNYETGSGLYHLALSHIDHFRGNRESSKGNAIAAIKILTPKKSTVIWVSHIGN